MKHSTIAASYRGKIIKSLKIGNHLRPYTGFFTKPTQTVFRNIIHEMLVMKIPNSTDLAFGLEKSISSISYFFNEARWDHRTIEQARKRVVQNAHETRSTEDDILVLDGSTISKTGVMFPDLSRVFDASEKKVTDGYYFFVASIINLKRNRSFIADWLLVAPKACAFKSIWFGWMRILKRIFAYSKAKLIVMDAGFRNQYLLKFIMTNNRFFLIRVLGDMVMLKNKTFLKLKTMKKQRGWRVKIGETTMTVRLMRGVMKAWSREVSEEITVIMVERSGFRHPLILATNQSITTLKEALCLYQAYCKRWSIEVLFKELKMELGLEKFRVRNMVAILRYLTLVVLAHTVLVLKLGRILDNGEMRSIAQSILAGFRKVSRLLIVSLKKLYEMLPAFIFSSKTNYSLQYLRIQSKS